MTGWLQIQRVGPNDAGVYTCTARNAFGEVSASARLQVTLGGMSENTFIHGLLENKVRGEQAEKT